MVFGAHSHAHTRCDAFWTKKTKVTVVKKGVVTPRGGERATGTLSKITTPGVEKPPTNTSKMRRNACVRDWTRQDALRSMYPAAAHLGVEHEVEQLIELASWRIDNTSTSSPSVEICGGWRFELCRDLRFY